MFTTFFSVALFLAFIQTVTAQLSINSTQLVQCQQVQINWVGNNNPPYEVAIVPANDICSDALESLCNLTGNSTTWTVNIASGTQVAFILYDAKDNEASSGDMTVGNSDDTSCLSSTTPFVTPTTISGAALPSSSSSSPAGAANAGLTNSGALSTRPLSAITLLGTSVLAVAAFAV